MNPVRLIGPIRPFGLIVALAFALSGCANPISKLLTTQSAKEKEIAALRVEYENKATEARDAQDRSTKALLASKDGQMQGAAAALHGQQLVFTSIITPTRTDLITHNLSKEAWTALGNIPPTSTALLAMNERISKELDATRTSLADLQANHVAALAQNQALAEQAKKHQVELSAAQEKIAAVEKEGAGKLAAKQGELIEIQGRLIAAEKQRADDAAALQALKTKFSIILGVLALAGIAGAIYSPIAKDKCAMFGVLCAASAIGIWYIQPWHVAVVVGLGLLGLIGWMLAKHRKDERVADALVLAAQDVKEQAGDVWQQHLQPAIEDRLARYRKTKGGKLVTEKDPALEAHIDQKLADYDVLPGKSTGA